jgi:HEAT repeat protein
MSVGFVDTQITPTETRPPSDETTSGGVAAPAADASAKVPTPRLVLQFFLGPLLIVLVCAGIYALFGLVVLDEKSPSDFLREIRTGSAGERWQAAFELSRWFASSPEATKDPAFARDLVELFRSSRHEDPRVRRYLALALGRLGDARGVEPLVEALEDEDGETRLYAAWSLGALKDPAAIPGLVASLGSDDPGMVKMTAYALGAIGDPAAAPALAPLLGNPAAEVRWNAALALAQIGDAAGLSVLLDMTDADALGRVDGITERQKIDATTNALRALHRLGDARGLERIRELERSSPYMEVRQTAAALAASAR